MSPAWARCWGDLGLIIVSLEIEQPQLPEPYPVPNNRAFKHSFRESFSVLVSLFWWPKWKHYVWLQTEQGTHPWTSVSMLSATLFPTPMRAAQCRPPGLRMGPCPQQMLKSWTQKTEVESQRQKQHRYGLADTSYDFEIRISVALTPEGYLISWSQ